MAGIWLTAVVGVAAGIQFVTIPTRSPSEDSKKTRKPKVRGFNLSQELTHLKSIRRNPHRLIDVVINIHCIESLKEMNMSYLDEDRDTYGMYKSGTSKGPGPELMGAHTLLGEDVYNGKDEDLGDIKEIILDMRTGRVSYAVLSFGGFLGMGEKLFAVPWNALTLDTVNKRFILKVDKERLKDAPGFDPDDWPDMASPAWAEEIHTYYGTKPYLDDRVI